MSEVAVPGPNLDCLYLVALQVSDDTAALFGLSAAWASVVATLAAWPDSEPGRPTVERRLWRTSRRGPLQEVVIAALHDPLGVHTTASAELELYELLRPLRSVRPMPRAGARTLAQLRTPVSRHAAELGRLERVLPEGPMR